MPLRRYQPARDPISFITKTIIVIGFIVALGIYAGAGYAIYQGFQAGPEGIGRAIGSVMRGVRTAW